MRPVGSRSPPAPVFASPRPRPPRPPGCPRAHWFRGLGGASRSRPAGPVASSRVAAGAGSHLPGGLGGGGTCLAPLSHASEVASAGACPSLACFHGNVGAAGRGGAERGVRGPLGLGQSWPAGPRPGRAAPGHADGRPDGGPACHARPRRLGTTSPGRTPPPPCRAPRFPLLLGFYSNGCAAESETDS